MKMKIMNFNLDTLNSTFSKIKNRKKHIILCCDFNYNLLKHECFDPVKEFLNIMFSNLV